MRRAPSSPWAAVARRLGATAAAEARPVTEPVDAEAPLSELRLGRLEPDRGIAAQRPDDPIVYWLADSLAEHLPVSLAAWRNRFVAEEAETDEDVPDAETAGDAEGGAAAEE